MQQGPLEDLFLYKLLIMWTQGNATATKLAKDDKEGNVAKELYNHYTVILFDEATQQYSQVANASYFKEETSAIVSAFDRWIAGASFWSIM